MSTKRRACQNDDELEKLEKLGIPQERQPRAMEIMNIIKCCPWQRKQRALSVSFLRAAISIMKNVKLN